MQLLTVAPHVVASAVSSVVRLADDVPKPEDVKAGWVAFAIFIGLIVAVALLGYSLVRQLRKAQAAEDAGLYDPSEKKPRHRIPQEPAPGRDTGETDGGRPAGQS